MKQDKTESSGGLRALIDELYAKLARLAGGASAGGVVNVLGSAPIASSGGAFPNISISAATDFAAGSMSAADKTKLDALAPGGVSSVSGNAPITSSGGTTPAIGITAATDIAAGSMSAADKTKLDGITAGAAVASVGATSPITTTGGANPNIGVLPAAVQSNRAAPLVSTIVSTSTAPSLVDGGGGVVMSATGTGTTHVTAMAQVSTANGATSVAGAAIEFQLLRSVGAGAFVVLATAPVVVAELSPTQAVANATFDWIDTGLTPGTRYRYGIQATNLTVPADTLTIQVGRASVTTVEIL